MVPYQIYHYTSIDTLALILESRKLRFNRLDRVDDLREAQEYQGITFGKYFFVSCWTNEEDESIPQWHMYTDKMTGVRISLPARPFQRKPFPSCPEWQIQTEHMNFSPLSVEEQRGRNYFVMPMFLDERNFAGPVVYVDNIEERYAEAVRVSLSPRGDAMSRISRAFDLVRMKSAKWAFQAEYRFFLLVVPSIPPSPAGPDTAPFYDAVRNDILRTMLRGNEPGIEFLDLDLSDEALNHIVVKTGPRCSPGAKLCVEALVKRYAPTGRVEPSSLSGTIRSPAR